MLTAKDMVFQRGEDGNLLPIEVELEVLPDKPKVKVRPLSRGKLQEIYQKATSEDPATKIQADNDVIVNGLVEPLMTEEQIKDMKPQYAAAIATAILSESLGISQDEVGKVTKETLSKQELEVKKN